MVLFIVQYILSLIIAFLETKEHRKITYLLLTIFTILFVFRKLTMNRADDIDEYRFFYNNINDDAVVARAAFEPGYVMLNRIFSFFRLPFEALQVAIGLFLTVVFWKVSDKYTGHPGLCLLASLFAVFYYATGALRQSIAVILFYYALHFLIEDTHAKRIALRVTESSHISLTVSGTVKFIIFVVICMFFHRSAIFLLVFPILKSKKGLLGVIAATLMLPFLFPYIEKLIAMIPYLDQKYQWYKNSTVTETGLTLRLIEYIGLAAILLFCKNRTKVEETALNLLILGIIPQAFLSNYISSTYRLLQYTDIGMVLFAGTFYNRLRSKNLQFLYPLAIGLLIFVRFYRLFSANADLNLNYGLLGF